MHVRWVVAVVSMNAALFAQSASPSCPADRPVDDMIAEMHKQQSKKKHRVGNPLPQITCIGGWCLDHSRTPPTIPEPAPRAELPKGDETRPIGFGSVHLDDCNRAMNMAHEAAHDVEVGDYYFETQKYAAALLRYKDAVDDKPSDAAIHVRLGRVLEKLNQTPQAIKQYETAQKLAGPQKWSSEAKSALLRLQHPPGS